MPTLYIIRCSALRLQAWWFAELTAEGSTAKHSKAFLLRVQIIVFDACAWVTDFHLQLNSTTKTAHKTETNHDWLGPILLSPRIESAPNFKSSQVLDKMDVSVNSFWTPRVCHNQPISMTSSLHRTAALIQLAYMQVAGKLVHLHYCPD